MTRREGSQSSTEKSSRKSSSFHFHVVSYLIPHHHSLLHILPPPHLQARALPRSPPHPSRLALHRQSILSHSSGCGDYLRDFISPSILQLASSRKLFCSSPFLVSSLKHLPHRHRCTLIHDSSAASRRIQVAVEDSSYLLSSPCKTPSEYPPSVSYPFQTAPSMSYCEVEEVRCCCCRDGSYGTAQIIFFHDDRLLNDQQSLISNEKSPECAH